MQHISFYGYVNYKNNLHIDRDCNGKPIIAGEQTWSYITKTDIYIGTNKELANLWEFLKVWGDYHVPCDTLKMDQDIKYCILAEKNNQFDEEIAYMQPCRRDALPWEFYKRITPYMKVYDDKYSIEKKCQEMTE